MSIDRSWHTNSAPHRRLRRGHRGEDVKRFQIGLQERIKHSPYKGELSVKADGVFGDKTLAAWRKIRFLIGLPVDHPPTRAAQLNVRRPWTRSPAAKRRAKQRRRGAAKPRILTAVQLGLSFAWVFGVKGPIYRGSGHYTAGGRASNASELAAEMRRDHAYHVSLRWGGLSYEAMFADDGTIGLGNPVGRKSAAVAGQNSGMTNMCAPGTTGDRLTPEQKASMRWYLDNAHTSAMPAAHRLPRPARELEWRGHKEWPLNATACPGDMLPDYKELW